MYLIANIKISKLHWKQTCNNDTYHYYIESWNDIGHMNVDNIDNDVLLTIITKLKNIIRALSNNVCLKSEHW